MPNKISYVDIRENCIRLDSLLLASVIEIFLLISCYCFFRYGRKVQIHNESGVSGQRIGSPNNYVMNLRHGHTVHRPVRTGLDFSEGF